MAVVTSFVPASPAVPVANTRLSDELREFGLDYWPAHVSAPGGVFLVAVTSNLPVSTTPVVKASWRPTSYRDDYYDRIHVKPSLIDLGNLLSSQVREVEVWNAHLTAKLLSSIDRSNTEGLTLAEPAAPPTTFAPNESRLYELSVSTNGPPTIDAAYTFNFAGEAPRLRVTGRRVVVWPFVPQTKFRETLEWMTDVMQAYSAEQRLALREAPRQVLQYDFQLDPQQFSRAKALSTAWAHRVYGAPVWAEATRLGALASGITLVVFNTADADYRNDDLILLWDDDENFVAAETTTVTPTGIELKQPLTRSFSNAYVMPLRFGRTLSGSEFSRDAHDVTKAKLSFQVTNNVDLGAASTFPQYRGKDVLTDRSVVLGDLSERIVRPVDVFDNGSGPMTTDQLRGYPDRTETVTFDPLNRHDAWTMRKWLHARRGRQRTFWVPSWNEDIVLVADVLASDLTIEVRNIGYSLYYGVTDVMVDLVNGTRIFKRILSGNVNAGGNEVLDLESSFGINIARTDVVRISLMKHVRFDSDRLELGHSYGGRVSVSVPVIEVPEG